MKQHQNRKVNLPTPFDHQLGVLRSAARFKVIACGRRWGKTTLAGIACVNGHGPDRRLVGAVSGGHMCWIAPTYSHTNEVWRFLKKSMELAWTDKNEVERRIELPGGGSITDEQLIVARFCRATSPRLLDWAVATSSRQPGK